VFFASVTDTFGPLHARAAAIMGVCLSNSEDAAVRRAALEDLLLVLQKKPKTGLWFISLLVKEICDTLRDVETGVDALKIWRVVFLEDPKRATDLGWASLIAYLGSILALDPTRSGKADQRKAFGDFLLQAARTSSAAFKVAVGRMTPSEKQAVEECVRLALAG